MSTEDLPQTTPDMILTRVTWELVDQECIRKAGHPGHHMSKDNTMYPNEEDRS